jgi:hypothetical protein
LSFIAICIFSIGISEASAERSFSDQKFVHSKIRNRLNEDIVQSEMRIRFNSTEIPLVPDPFSESNIAIDETDLLLSDEEEETEKQVQ